MTEEEKIDRENLEKVEEEVFKNAYIPRTMDEILDAERDAFKVPKSDDDHVNVYIIKLKAYADILHYFTERY
jgi:hypothetical protein